MLKGMIRKYSSSQPDCPRFKIDPLPITPTVITNAGMVLSLPATFPSKILHRSLALEIIPLRAFLKDPIKCPEGNI
jgi:hypothetical protein